MEMLRSSERWLWRVACASMLLVVVAASGCGGREASVDSGRMVNFLPNTHIDSLYVSYANATGQKRVSYANNLLSAINEEEDGDDFMQFATNENPDVMDATVNFWMGEYLCYSSLLTEAENVSLLALEQAKKIGDSELEVELYSLLGLIYQRMGRNDESLRYNQLCYEASCRSGNLEDHSSDLSNLAAISLTLDNAELARSYIDKAIEIERKLGRDDMLAIRYGLASEIYQKLGELNQAEQYAREAYALDSKGGREGKVAIRRSQLAAVLIAKGDDDEAIEQLQLAVEPLKANGNNYSLAVVESQLGQLYLDRHLDSIAAEHFLVAYEVSKDGGNLYMLQRALDGLANSLKSSDVSRAYDYLAESAVVADSIYRLNNKKELAEIEQKYKESEALRESEHQVYERKIQNYALLIVLSVAVLVITVQFFVIRSKNKGQRIMRSLEKMRSNFFTNVTHEFRTPITVIMGLSTDIAHDRNASKEVKAAADVITAQGNGLLDLVNQLLDISKVQSEIGTPDWRRGNVVSYMHMIAEKYSQTASHKGVDLVFSPSENVIIMDFIPQYMHKILHNLISNSLKFTPKGGRIYLSTGVRDNKLRLRIADTGVGIDRADLSHIFEPYYQGENSDMGMGTGIGLSLVDRMVHAMGGTITAKSVRGKGSVFTINIPLTHADDVEEMEDTERYSSDTVDNLTTDSELTVPQSVASGEEQPIVLIVEDNNEVASYIGSHLSQYNVQYARNGREGFAKAKELIPDVIITDLMMPEMDGVEMTRKIREDEAVNHVPVIVITAKAEDAAKIRALQTGVDAYLVKPFNQDELQVRVNQLIAQRRMLCEKYQRALAAGKVDNEDLPVADRRFISNMVGIVYDMISKGEVTDLEVVANKMNLTSRTFSRKLQALTGDSPLLYINKIKVSKAKTLIDSDSTIALSSVAYQCGFDDPNYFSRIFKQIEGISPTAYRRRVK